MDTPSGVLNADKPRLTEQEKKNNHIQSEQKRRAAIREGFDELAGLIPGLNGQGRSEAVVLEGSSKFIRELLAERYRLMTRVSERGGALDRWQLDDATMAIAKEQAEAEHAVMIGGRR